MCQPPAPHRIPIASVSGSAPSCTLTRVASAPCPASAAPGPRSPHSCGHWWAAAAAARARPRAAMSQRPYRQSVGRRERAAVGKALVGAYLWRRYAPALTRCWWRSGLHEPESEPNLGALAGACRPRRESGCTWGIPAALRRQQESHGVMCFCKCAAGCPSRHLHGGWASSLRQSLLSGITARRCCISPATPGALLAAHRAASNPPLRLRRSHLIPAPPHGP